MKTDISQIVQQFKNFLENQVGNFKPSNVAQLLQYGFNISLDYDSLLSLLEDSKFPITYYFDKPDKKFSTICIDQAFSFNSNSIDRFSIAEHHLNALNGNIISNLDDNRNIPLIFSYGAFFPQVNDKLWSDFRADKWFIPKFLVVSDLSGTQYLYNYYIPSNSNLPILNVINDFKELVKYIENKKVKRYNSSNKEVQQKFTLIKDNRELWEKKVQDIKQKIINKEISKAVLSRFIRIKLANTLSVPSVLKKFRQMYSNCYIFCVRNKKSIFFGATPETLIKIKNNKVECPTIAGSIKRTNNEHEDKRLEEILLQSKKDKNEHEIVVNHIQNVLNRYCDNIKIDPFPKLKKLSYILHLQTDISGRLKENVSIFNLLQDLYPTPAVGGYPVDKALEVIKQTEDYDRGLYSGFLGWLNSYGEGEFCVTIRSALVKNKNLYVFAGAGIVEDSIPHLEFEETETKLKAITSLIKH